MANQEFKTIPVSDLHNHPKNPRVLFRKSVVDSIAADLKVSGFKPANGILVRPHDGGYQVISGHHRKMAALQAGLIEVPCFVEDMTDAEAYRRLVKENKQSELAKIEIGIHALHCIPPGKVGAGRGNKAGLSEYSLDIDISESEVRRLRDAAEVFTKFTNEKSSDIGGFSVEEFLLDKHNYLSAIHSAPSESWPALCEYLLTAQDVTVAKISGKAKELAELKKSIPDWWEVDFAALSPSVINDAQYGSRLAGVFKYAKQQADAFKLVTLYKDQRTVDMETRNGREYYKVEPVAYEYDAPAVFKKKISDCGTLPKIDQLREMAREIEVHIRLFSSDEVRWLPVLTDEEQAEAEENRRVQQRHEERDRSIATVHLGDCVQGLRTYTGPKIDLLLTDPPYGMAFQSNRRTASDKTKEINGDASIDAAINLFDAMMTAVLAHLAEDAHVVVFCCDEFEPQFRALLSGKGLTFKRLLVWVKPNHGSGDLQGSFAPRKELALHFVQGSPSVSPRIDDVFIQDQGEFVTDHPTEKPVSLLKAWINSTTQPGDLVVDPFMGTGATLVAAKQLDRLYRGFDMEDHYYQQAIERIKAEVN